MYQTHEMTITDTMRALRSIARHQGAELMRNTFAPIMGDERLAEITAMYCNPVYPAYGNIPVLHQQLTSEERERLEGALLCVIGTPAWYGNWELTDSGRWDLFAPDGEPTGIWMHDHANGYGAAPYDRWSVLVEVPGGDDDKICDWSMDFPLDRAFNDGQREIKLGNILRESYESMDNLTTDELRALFGCAGGETITTANGNQYTRID